MIEIAKVSILFLLLCIVPFLFAGLFLWAIFFGSVGVVLVVIEIIAFRKTGNTLSEQFRKSSKAFVLAGCLCLFTAYLMLHLLRGW